MNWIELNCEWMSKTIIIQRKRTIILFTSWLVANDSCEVLFLLLSTISSILNIINLTHSMNEWMNYKDNKIDPFQESALECILNTKQKQKRGEKKSWNFFCLYHHHINNDEIDRERWFSSLKHTHTHTNLGDIFFFQWWWSLFRRYLATRFS